MIDSGLGGLSLFIKHIRQTLPNEDIISFADSKYIPYGDKNSDWIVSRNTYLISNHYK
ncbi:hypothetical protein BE1S18E01_00770 [Acinetobacter sp. BEC1-S18-ESBL-01]|jgi:glutamate racemase|nr:hypothetical protein F930_00620 [Acinetobacter pittii ANC 3678]EXC29875.1 glutamate racemase 1 domain protein [Acinetobacter sp. 809848]SSO89295.1 glutamate racemase [Acinetobacter baumannii]SSP25924.1 glutamate racemase [Acinetobacter pittii]BBU16549.1 hypothetical protein BE1S18E01_00770 [Acinetobacter sp. BEC1-S18-ESBL-01]